MTVTASQLRADIYRLLDEVVDTGVPLEIERKGRRLRIVAVETRSKLDNIKGDPNAITGDPGDLPDVHWDHYWNPDPL